MTQCPTTFRFPCIRAESGEAGLTAEELAAVIAPFLPGGGSYLDLSDTDNSYVGEAGNVPVVNGGETGLEFGTVGGVGVVKQVVSASIGTLIPLTGEMPLDDTIPQITEGTNILSLNITPQNATNILLIDFNTFGASTNTGFIRCAVFRSDSTDSIGAVVGNRNSGDYCVMHVQVDNTASVITPITISARASGNSAGTSAYINGRAGDLEFGTAANTNLRVIEISA